MTLVSRRRMMGLIVIGGLAAPVVARAQSAPQRNISSFTMQRWQDHFDNLGLGAIVADTGSRALHFWSGDGETYRTYPTSVPISEELTKRGHTEIVRKKEGPAGHLPPP